ncbi:MAG TPA: hypothetical protein VIT42_05855, partial [Microlunatus sp.]
MAISNGVINLSTDKPAVLGAMFRVLAPGGRIGISDVVAEDLAAAGFVDAAVEFTQTGSQRSSTDSVPARDRRRPGRPSWWCRSFGLGGTPDQPRPP